MISDQAKTGFDQLLTRALVTGMGGGTVGAVQAGIVHDTAEFAGTEIVALTISSYLFRLMVMIQFTPDDLARHYFAQLAGLAADDAAGLDQQAMRDAVAECGNLTCGILNRELGEFFPHIGMSTPNFIDRKSMAYLPTQNRGHLQRFQVDVECGMQFNVTLCVFDYADMDFTVNPYQESADTGELELF